MTDERLDNEIRLALEAKAEEVAVPGDLATRTIEAARDASPPSLLERLRAWRDSRTASPRGYPRWVYIPAAVAGATAMYLIGGVAINNDGVLPTRGADQAVVDTDETTAENAGAEPAVRGPEVALSADNDAAKTMQAPGAPLVDRQGGGVAGGSGAGQVAPDIAPQPVPPSRPGTPPKLVRSADVDVEVRKGGFSRAWASANQIAARHGGYVSNSSTEQVKGRLARGSIIVSVPATKLDAALRDFGRLGTVLRSTQTSADVAAQFVDTDARLRTLRAQETQLVALLDRANSLSEILEIRSQLNAVRGEIEQLQAQREFLQGQVDFSTITASIHEAGVDAVDPSQPGRLESAWDAALTTGARTLAGILVVLAVLIPLALFAALIWGAVRLVRSRV